jgi:hypothetical protein
MTDIQAILKDKSPRKNKDAWTLYTKYNRIQQTSVLFDFQQVAWSPFKDDGHPMKHNAFNIEGYVGDIYTAEMAGDELTTAVAVNKGDIKWITHYDQNTLVQEDDIRGSLELRIGAFVTAAFKKFSGILSFKSIGDDVVAIDLKVDEKFILSLKDEELNKNIKRLYNRRDWK